MSRQSGDVLAPDGSVRDGFDYALQVWVRDGLILSDGHPKRLDHCKACRFSGVPVVAVPGHERRDTGPCIGCGAYNGHDAGCSVGMERSR